MKILCNSNYDNIWNFSRKCITSNYVYTYAYTRTCNIIYVIYYMYIDFMSVIKLVLIIYWVSKVFFDEFNINRIKGINFYKATQISYLIVSRKILVLQKKVAFKGPTRCLYEH